MIELFWTSERMNFFIQYHIFGPAFKNQIHAKQHVHCSCAPLWWDAECHFMLYQILIQMRRKWRAIFLYSIAFGYNDWTQFFSFRRNLCARAWFVFFFIHKYSIVGTAYVNEILDDNFYWPRQLDDFLSNWYIQFEWTVFSGTHHIRINDVLQPSTLEEN